MNEGSTFKPSKAVDLLLVGPPLSGKTNVAMCFPNPWFGSTDRKIGNATVRFPGKKFWYDYGDCDAKGTELPLPQRWDLYVAHVKAAIIHPEVQTIVIDNLSDLGDYLIAHILNKAGGAGNLIAGEKLMSLPMWGPFATLLTGLFGMLKSCGKHVVVCAHEVADKDEVTGAVNYRPKIPGQLRDTLGGKFSNIWHTETRLNQKGGVDYFVRTAPQPRMSLGNSFNLPPDFVFSWEEFKKYMEKV